MVIQQHRRKLLMMGILMTETCRVYKKENKKEWRLVGLFYSYHNDARSNKHNYQRTSVSVALHWLLFKTAAIFLYVQILRVSKKICCLSGNFIISSYAVTGLHDSLQEFSCLLLLPVDHVLHLPPTRSNPRTWDLVTAQARPMDDNECEVRESSVCQKLV